MTTLARSAPQSPVTYSMIAPLLACVATVAAFAPVRRFDQMSLAMMLRAE